MPSNSSFGPMPINAARVAWHCLSRVASSECPRHNALNVWLARMLFQLSDREPPMSFRTPLASSGSFTTTVEHLLSLPIFFLSWNGLLDGSKIASGLTASTTCLADEKGKRDLASVSIH